MTELPLCAPSVSSGSIFVFDQSLPIPAAWGEHHARRVQQAETWLAMLLLATTEERRDGSVRTQASTHALWRGFVPFAPVALPDEECTVERQRNAETRRERSRSRTRTEPRDGERRAAGAAPGEQPSGLRRKGRGFDHSERSSIFDSLS